MAEVLLEVGLLLLIYSCISDSTSNKKCVIILFVC